MYPRDVHFTCSLVNISKIKININFRPDGIGSGIIVSDPDLVQRSEMFTMRILFRENNNVKVLSSEN
jgi:hypothetical protein